LKRHLPEDSLMLQPGAAAGWTAERYDAAKAFILRIRDCHDSALPEERPHAALIEQTSAKLSEPELALSLERGWILAREASVSPASASPLTPVTRLAPPVHVVRSGRITAVTVIAGAQGVPAETMPNGLSAATLQARPTRQARQLRGPIALVALIATCAVAATLWYAGGRPAPSEIQALAEPLRAAADHAGDAMHRLLRRDERAPGIDTVSEAAPAPAATSNDTVPLRPPAQAAVPEPIAPSLVPNVAPPQSASPLIASTTDAVANAPLPPTQAPRDKSPTALPQHPIQQAYGWSGARARSSALAPAKQASTPSQSSTTPAATVTRIELAQPSAALDVASPVAGAQPVSVGASLASADPPAAMAAAGDPRGNAVASPVRQPSRSASRGAPVEDRSESLKL